METLIDIVFDGPPGPEAGRFVEVENSTGNSINYGEWVQRKDGYWCLRIPDANALHDRIRTLEADRDRLAAENASKAEAQRPGPTLYPQPAGCELGKGES